MNEQGRKQLDTLKLTTSHESLSSYSVSRWCCMAPACSMHPKFCTFCVGTGNPAACTGGGEVPCGWGQLDEVIG